jgi:hypothetical protein
MKDELLDCCRAHVLNDGEAPTTVREPYIPFIPEDWNGRLVLAEAQNHGIAAVDYLHWLKGLSSDERLNRLYLREHLGIQPWDDGTLKLAVASAFCDDPIRWGVSNAVLWSMVDSAGRNQTPSDFTKRRSLEVWTDFLRIMKPQFVLASGKIATSIVTAAREKLGKAIPYVSVCLPAPTNLSRVSGMFAPEDLLNRFPEVGDVLSKHEDWLTPTYRSNKIFFACHTVSKVKKCIPNKAQQRTCKMPCASER